MKKIIGLLAILAMIACKQEKKENVASTDEIARPEVKLYTFSGGTVLVNKLELFSQDTTYQGQSKEFSDGIYVISHPKGNLIWDTGLPEGLIGIPEAFTSPDGAFTISRKSGIVEQLGTIGLTPDDFDYIALSHTHFDHSGSANAFKNATWLVQEPEYDFVTSEEVQKNNADLYANIKDLNTVQKLNGDYDVFGDGSVIIKSMPGHTPGHQVLFVDLIEHGPLLLSGDLYHLYENRTHKRVPSFNFNVEQTLTSMGAFETFAKKKHAKVYLQHQKEDFDKMPKAPNFLK